MKREKQVFNIGDLFIVEVSDGSFSIGEIIGIEPKALNSVICAFYDCRIFDIHRCDKVSLNEENLIAVLFVTRDLLDSGQWKIISKDSAFSIEKYLNLDVLRKQGFIGIKIIGSRNVIKFLNAYYGLGFWNIFFDPNYLDSLLISPNKKPNDLIYR